MLVTILEKLHFAMSLALPLIRTRRLPAADSSTDGPNLAGLLLGSRDMAKASPNEPLHHADAKAFDRKTVLGLLNHSAEALELLRARCEELEAGVAEAQLVARAEFDRAELINVQVQELQSQLSEADLTSLELRSRLVCLYSKLSTSADTVRLYTMARALSCVQNSDVYSPTTFQNSGSPDFAFQDVRPVDPARDRFCKQA